MATRPFTADDGADLPAHGAPAGAGRINRHQLTVMAASTAEVVRWAGGWLFDRAGAGWDVRVVIDVLDGGRDVRPLAILGATPIERDSVRPHALPPNGALAVSAELVRADARVRAHVLELVKSGGQVTVWGEDWPVELGGPIEPTEHRLSVAARAFKARALTAAHVRSGSCDVGVTATEKLFDLRAGSVRPLYRV